MELNLLFYLPFPKIYHHKNIRFSDREIGIRFSRFVKARDHRHKYLLESQRLARDFVFTFPHKTLVKERYIEINVDWKYFKSSANITMDEVHFMAIAKQLLKPNSKVINLISSEIERITDYEAMKPADEEYLNNWIERILYYLSKSLEVQADNNNLIK